MGRCLCGPPGRAGPGAQGPGASASLVGAGPRFPTAARPAHTALTLSRSSGCVQQAAPHEARPPKYQRETRTSAAMPGSGRPGAPAARVRSRRGHRSRPGPRLPPPPPPPPSGFKAPSATRAANAPARPGGVARLGGVAGQTPPRGRGRTQRLKAAAAREPRQVGPTARFRLSRGPPAACWP